MILNDPDCMDRLFKSGDQICQIWAVVEQPLPDGATKYTKSKGPPMSNISIYTHDGSMVLVEKC